MARKEHYLVGLDVGTSKIAAIVAEALEEGLERQREATEANGREAAHG